MNMRLRVASVSYWMIVIPLYCWVSFYVLWQFGGPTADGSGIVPSVILPGLHPPSVSLRVYIDSWKIRLEYRLPYFVLALIFTFMGYCVPCWLLSHIPKLSSHTFTSSVAVAMLCLLLGPAIADAGTHLKFWGMT